MAINLGTPNFHVQEVNSFANHFANGLLNTIYFFASDHGDHSNNVIQTANADVQDEYTNPYLRMLFGKQLTSNNFLPAITNQPYAANTIYAMYDDQDPLLSTEKYYAVVNAGSFSHVFKVLDNNMGVPSTVQPDFSQITGSNTIIYQTSDGYRWKYMYTVDSTTILNAGTPTFFPYLANSTVISQAVGQTIDICKIIQPGALYNNWSLGIFKTSDINIGGNPAIFNLSNNQVSTVNGYYSQCILYLTSGPGIGQYATIANSFSNTTGNFIQIANAFPIIPTNGTTFQIYPQFEVVGTGTQTQNVIARALVNSSASNSIYRVEVLQRGIGFANVLSSNVLANSVVGVSLAAQIRPIMPPPGGHGANPAVELGATNLIIWAQLNDTESNTIPDTNQYQQIGLLTNPIFANAHLTLQQVSLSFQPGEMAFLINPVQAQPLCNVQVSNNFVATNNGAFGAQFNAGDPILLVSNTGTLAQLCTVNNVVNANFLFLTSNVNFSCTNVVVYEPNIYGNVVLTVINSLSDVYVANVPGSMTTGSQLIGATSGAYASINAIARNDVAKSFNTFVQLNKYSVTVSSGAFIQNETVMQGNTTALYHSGNTSSIYLSNVNGITTVSGQNLIGQQSGAIAQITKIYPQELNFNSGEIFYVENISPIVRQSGQQESFKLVYNF